MASAILFLLAAVPCLYWTQGIETRPAVESAGLKRLCVPSAQADAWRKAGFTVTASRHRTTTQAIGAYGPA